MLPSVTPANVHEILRRHLLVDGFSIVPDLAKSRDAYLADARDGRRYLDFFSFYASQPLGFNHPRLAEAGFANKLGRAAIHKPSNPDMNTVLMAEFVATFERVGIPPELPHLFVVDGGSVAEFGQLRRAADHGECASLHMRNQRMRCAAPQQPGQQHIRINDRPHAVCAPRARPSLRR